MEHPTGVINPLDLGIPSFGNQSLAAHYRRLRLVLSVSAPDHGSTWEPGIVPHVFVHDDHFLFKEKFVFKMEFFFLFLTGDFTIFIFYKFLFDAK